MHVAVGAIGAYVGYGGYVGYRVGKVVSPVVMDMIEAKMMADTVDFMLSDIDVGVVIDQSVGCWILDGRRFMRPR